MGMPKSRSTGLETSFTRVQIPEAGNATVGGIKAGSGRVVLPAIA